MSKAIRGNQRELGLTRSAYFADGYFALPQLCSLSQQIHEIHLLKPKNILEIGIGNGFTSTFLRRAGYSVTTADINPALEPDICASLDEVSSHINDAKFDLVVCCEVLEHMPYEQFTRSLDHLRSLGDRLFMTLPNHKTSIGFGGFIHIPRLSPKVIGAAIDFPWRRRLVAEHFWEVGITKNTSRRVILRELRSRYEHARVKTLALNPYHIAFYGY